MTNQLTNLILNNLGLKASVDQVKAATYFSELISNSKLKRGTFVLKGYAGTGKTSLIGAVVKTLKSIEMNYQLLAPTGRAAKVMATYSNDSASTIHRHIYKASENGNTSLLFDNRPNRESNTVYIVDEASMITDRNESGRNLLGDLVEFVFSGSGENGNKLILIGDVAQLPPVGQILSPALDVDTLRTVYKLNAAEVVLSTVHRQLSNSGILFNATGLRANLNANINSVSFSIDQYKDIYKIGDKKLFDCLRYSYNKFGPENTVLLARSNKRAVVLNQLVRKYIKGFKDELVVGDSLMVVKNNYTLLQSEEDFVANGDFLEIQTIGEVVERFGFRFMRVSAKLDASSNLNKVVSTWIMLDCLNSAESGLSTDKQKQLTNAIYDHYARTFDNPTDVWKQVRSNPFYNALQAKYAYALTCHKSQGGQWDCVIIDFPYAPTIESEYLRWLYTAVTRSVKELYLMNFPDHFFATLQRAA